MRNEIVETVARPETREPMSSALENGRDWSILSQICIEINSFLPLRQWLPALVKKLSNKCQSSDEASLSFVVEAVDPALIRTLFRRIS